MERSDSTPVVRIYEHGSMTGDSESYYTEVSDASLGPLNAKVSSIEILDDNYKVTLFKEKDFKDDYLEVTSNIDDLNDYSFDNKFRSLLIELK